MKKHSTHSDRLDISFKSVGQKRARKAQKGRNRKRKDQLQAFLLYAYRSPQAVFASEAHEGGNQEEH